MTERSCVSKPERMIYHRNGIRYHSDTMVVISIVSSPRKGGFGDRIARRIEEGAESVGKEVIYLKRLQMGSLVLDTELKPGEYRKLTKEEVDSLC